MTELEKYYNKFPEEKRLTRRHGRVEFITTMKYIHECLANVKQGTEETGREGFLQEAGRETPLRILDVGAGTGRYSTALAAEGFDVTAVELVRYNLGILKSKKSPVRAYQGNALDLSRFPDDSFDITLLLGPMYHLYCFEDKCRALREAGRVTRAGGRILVAYCMNEYGVLLYGFRDGHAGECLEDGRLSEEFHCVSGEKEIYDYVRLEDIDRLNGAVGLRRVKIISPDGPANYMRQTLNAMDEESFEIFVRYHLSVCERQDLIGAGAHTLDILEA